MKKTAVIHDYFKFSYRADCTVCGDYVGPQRETKQEADVDKHDHIYDPNHNYKDHDVKIEVTQSFHII